MLAHIRNGEIIKRYASERGWVALEKGGYASPPVAGFVHGNDRIVPIEEVTDDRSTTENKVTTVTTTVEETRCLVTRTIRDKTAQELDAEKDVMIASESDVLLAKALFQVVNQIRSLQSQPALTGQQFRTWLKGMI